MKKNHILICVLLLTVILYYFFYLKVDSVNKNLRLTKSTSRCDLLNVGNFSVGESPGDLIIDDFDNDGKQDIATTDGALDRISILFNKGDGTLTQPENYAVKDMPHCIASGKLNGDNFPDLAVPSFLSNEVLLFLNEGNGTFSPFKVIPTDEEPLFVLINDLNNDEYGDIVVANGAANSVSVFFNDGNGEFESPVNYAVGKRPIMLAIGDINGDGYADLITANIKSANVSILINKGSGDFDGSTNHAISQNALTGIRRIAAKDLTNNGLADLILMSEYPTGNVTVLANYKDKEFTKQFSLDVFDPNDLEVGDLDGDGLLDIIIASLHSGNLEVYFNEGNGKFSKATNYIIRNWPADSTVIAKKFPTIAIGYLNSDAFLDIAIANTATDDITILINKRAVESLNGNTIQVY